MWIPPSPRVSDGIPAFPACHWILFQGWPRGLNHVEDHKTADARFNGSCEDRRGRRLCSRPRGPVGGSMAH